MQPHSFLRDFTPLFIIIYCSIYLAREKELRSVSVISHRCLICLFKTFTNKAGLWLLIILFTVINWPTSIALTWKEQPIQFLYARGFRSNHKICYSNLNFEVSAIICSSDYHSPPPPSKNFCLQISWATFIPRDTTLKQMLFHRKILAWVDTCHAKFKLSDGKSPGHNKQ